MRWQDITYLSYLKSCSLACCHNQCLQPYILLYSIHTFVLIGCCVGPARNLHFLARTRTVHSAFVVRGDMGRVLKRNQQETECCVRNTYPKIFILPSMNFSNLRFWWKFYSFAVLILHFKWLLRCFSFWLPFSLFTACLVSVMAFEPLNIMCDTLFCCLQDKTSSYPADEQLVLLSMCERGWVHPHSFYSFYFWSSRSGDDVP